MAKVSEMIISKFLKQQDLDDDLTVTIRDCVLEDVPGDRPEKRWVLAFRELPKALVLNVTTIKVLEKAFGSDSDAWIGKRVVLYVDPNVSFKGQVVGGLRLRPVKATKPVKTPPSGTAAVKAALVGAAAEQDFDDEIP